MERYRNLSGKSGVVAYAIGSDFIKVRFKDGPVYHYSNASAGTSTIEQMKAFATAGRGLSTFISQEHPPYEGEPE